MTLLRALWAFSAWAWGLRLPVPPSAPVPREHRRDDAAARDYGTAPDVPRHRDGRVRGPWFIGVVASVMLLGCGPTATEAAVRDLHRLTEGCASEAERIAEEATSLEAGRQALHDLSVRCTADACAYCRAHEIDCSPHGLTCPEVTP